jgi:hypothetical protein
VIDYRTGELDLHWRHGPPPSVVRYREATAAEEFGA